MNDFKGSIFAFLGNLWGSGSYAAVLDADFEVLDVAKIGLRQGRWENAISDVRLWADPAGDLIISFMPYYFAERFHNFVAKLHLDSEAGRLEAWVDRREVRRAQSCGESDGPKKNLGFFALNGSTFALDKISPTSVDAFDLSELELEKEPQALARHNHSYPQVTLPALCMAPAGPGGTMPREDPWKDCRGQEKELFLHNGPPPLWLEEPGFYLGIGHLVRGKREMRPFHYTLPDHYTHQFFALSATRPFRLLALSPEFCFSSEQDAEDCENIQFASSLLREGNDSLLVGYGVQDCDAFLQRLSLHEVLASLVALE